MAVAITAVARKWSDVGPRRYCRILPVLLQTGPPPQLLQLHPREKEAGLNGPGGRDGSDTSCCCLRVGVVVGAAGPAAASLATCFGLCSGRWRFTPGPPTGGTRSGSIFFCFVFVFYVLFLSSMNARPTSLAVFFFPLGDPHGSILKHKGFKFKQKAEGSRLLICCPFCRPGASMVSYFMVCRSPRHGTITTQVQGPRVSSYLVFDSRRNNVCVVCVCAVFTLNTVPICAQYCTFKFILLTNPIGARFPWCHNNNTWNTTTCNTNI